MEEATAKVSCSKTLFSVNSVYTNNVLNVLNAHVEPDLCFKNSNFDANIVFAPSTPLKMIMTRKQK